MKLPGLLLYAKAFLRGARALEGIQLQLLRIADALEGKAPATLTPVPESTERVVHTPLSNDDYLRLEAIEAFYQRHHGRPPTADEAQHAFDDEEWTAADLPAHTRERLGL